jgi:superfamily II DNA or RNA helicase
MNRDLVNKSILELSDKYSNILCELPTGFGKTKQALDILKRHIKKLNQDILIVIPRNVLIESWKQEFKKWGMEKYLLSVTFTTYVSLPKHEGKWDMVIFDECHHLSERCREALTNFDIKRAVLLSATVKRDMKDELNEVFDNLISYKIKMKEAIDNEVLPDPKVFLLPLTLDAKFPTESIWKNPKGKEPVVEVPWATRWTAIKQKVYKVRIYCSEYHYHQDLCSQIEWHKNRYMRTRNKALKAKWLKLAGDRLKWLSDKKMSTMQVLKEHFKNERVLLFCNSIEQTEVLGNCINSKFKSSLTTLEDFNKGKINQISAVNMLNEGCNLVNCRIGIYGNLNSSEIIVKQRLGRILRHKDPIIIIPYYKNTREEELVTKMLEDYNPELIKTINDIKEIKL